LSTSYRIKVLGRELLVKSKAPAETVREIEAFVNGKISEVTASVKGGDPQVVAILAMMNIAEAYLSLIKEKDALGMQTEKVNRLLQRLDSVVEKS
jgi:cell division protein ZapA